MPASVPVSTRMIQEYYDLNTRLFLAFGSSFQTGSIHRSVWAPGVRTLDEAFDYTNSLILEQIRRGTESSPAGHLQMADLGCGVGGTLFSILPRLNTPAAALGLTISPVQANLARRRAAQLGLEKTVHFVEADFLAPPVAPGLDLVWSVEAFLHAEQPARYFAAVSGMLRPRGRLILCDDFLAWHGNQKNDPAGITGGDPARKLSRQRWLETYRQGWHALNLLPLARVEELACEFDLFPIHRQNLTPHLRLRALPDWLANTLLAGGQRIPVRYPILPSMLGSIALQQCLSRGWIAYHFLVFEKR